MVEICRKQVNCLDRNVLPNRPKRSDRLLATVICTNHHGKYSGGVGLGFFNQVSSSSSSSYKFTLSFTLHYYALSSALMLLLFVFL